MSWAEISLGIVLVYIIYRLWRIERRLIYIAHRLTNTVEISDLPPDELQKVKSAWGLDR